MLQMTLRPITAAGMLFWARVPAHFVCDSLSIGLGRQLQEQMKESKAFNAATHMVALACWDMHRLSSILQAHLRLSRAILKIPIALPLSVRLLLTSKSCIQGIAWSFRGSFNAYLEMHFARPYTKLTAQLLQPSRPFLTPPLS